MLTRMKKDSTFVAAVRQQWRTAQHLRPHPAHTESSREEKQESVRVHDLNFLAPGAVRLRQGTSVKQLVSKLFFELVRILAQKNSSVEKLGRVFFTIRASAFRKNYLSSSVKN